MSRLSTAGVVFSLAHVVAGLLAAPINPLVHASLIGLGAALVFPLSIYLTFTASLTGGRIRRGLPALAALLSLVLASVSPAAHIYVGPTATAVLVIAALLLQALFIAVDSSEFWRRSEHWSIYMVPPLYGAVSTATILESASGAPLMLPILLGMFYAVPMIFVVGLSTVSRNYGAKPSTLRILAPLSTLGLSLAILAAMPSEWRSWLALALVAMLVYVVCSNYYRAPRLYAKSRGMPWPAGPALRYMASAHTLIALMPMASLAALALGYGLVDIVHLVFIGFIGLHIYLHAPLMLPQITRVKLAKSYNPLPLALLAAAAVSRLEYGLLSLALVAASLAFLLLVFRPEGLVKPRDG